MPELIKHLNLFNEIFQGLSSHVPFPELFDCDFGAHPSCLEYISIATAADKIRLGVNLELLIVNEKVEAVLTQCHKQPRVLPKRHR